MTLARAQTWTTLHCRALVRTYIYLLSSLTAIVLQTNVPAVFSSQGNIPYNIDVMQYDMSTPTIYLVAYFQISNGIQNDSIVKITATFQLLFVHRFLALFF